MHLGSQSVLQPDGHNYDKIIVKDKNGAEHTLYFNIDIRYKHYGV
jgi:hypothetical protein